MSAERIAAYRDASERVALRQAIRRHPMENPPRFDGLDYPYANINLTAEQLQRLPMYARVAIAHADGQINRLRAGAR